MDNAGLSYVFGLFLNQLRKNSLMDLDKIDKRLLEMLQEDSTTDIKTISSKLNLSKTPIYNRIKKFVASGFIKKYVAVLDTTKVEKMMVVFCSVSLEKQKLKEINEFKKAIQKIPEVVECYLMGGANDFLLKVIVKDLKDYHKFSSEKLAALNNISQIKSTFVLDEFKRSTVIPIY